MCHNWYKQEFANNVHCGLPTVTIVHFQPNLAQCALWSPYSDYSAHYAIFGSMCTMVTIERDHMVHWMIVYIVP